MAEFPRFKELPTEIRLEMWRLISIQESSRKPVNIYPQCDGYHSSDRCMAIAEQMRTKIASFRTPSPPEEIIRQWISLELEQQRQIQMHRHKESTRTPLPITTKINSESRAETFQYWVIELCLPRSPLCFLPSHHQLYADWCCFSQPERFGNWIKYLKQQHPGRFEKATDIEVTGICWLGTSGFEKQIKEWNGGSLELSEKSVGAKHDGPLDALLKFPRLKTLRLDVFWPRFNDFPKGRYMEILEGFKEFVELHQNGFEKSLTEVQDVQISTKGSAEVDFRLGQAVRTCRDNG